jgi:hypothetical protein
MNPGFDSWQAPYSLDFITAIQMVFLVRFQNEISHTLDSSVAEQRIVVPLVVGSNPAPEKKPLAQMM